MTEIKRILGQYGYRHLVVLDDGTEAWIEDAEQRQAGKKRIRRVDIVEKLMRENLIGSAERAAAGKFERDYEGSSLKDYYSASMVLDGGGGFGSAAAKKYAVVMAAQKHTDAHRAACQAVGPYAAQTLVDLLCVGRRLADYASRSEQAQRRGALITGLQGLVGHYGWSLRLGK